MITCCSNKQDCCDLKRAVKFLKIIADENRLKILCILSKHDEQCVCEILDHLKIPQNLTSHHLKVLKKFGLLTSRKKGLNVFYALNEKTRDEYSVLLERILTKGKNHE